MSNTRFEAAVRLVVVVPFDHDPAPTGVEPVVEFDADDRAKRAARNLHAVEQHQRAAGKRAEGEALDRAVKAVRQAGLEVAEALVEEVRLV